MDTFFNSLKTSFLIVGTIVGAGFVSGREISAFFGKGNIFLSALAAAAALFLLIFFLLELGRRFKSLGGVNKAMFKKADKAVGIASFICLFAVAAAGAAAIDALGAAFGIPRKVPVLSALSLIAVGLFARKGIKGLALLDIILVPAMILLAVALMLVKNKFDFSPAAGGGSGVILYVCFNVFTAAAVVTEAGASLSRSSSMFVAAFSALLVALLVILVYGAIGYEGANAFNAELPLLYALASLGKGYAVCFGVALFFGAFTTLAAACYPLQKGFEKALGRRGDVTALFSVFLLAQLGIEKIVGRIYPAAGLLGLVYFAYVGLASAYKYNRKRK